MYADPTPNALQVFLTERELDDAANTPISLTSGQGLAPSAASAMMDDDDATNATADIEMTDLPTEEGTERGVWINADPLPGCVVCNIGESEFFWAFELTLLKIERELIVDTSVGSLGEWIVQEYAASCPSSWK